jgi:hypothetical protein
MREFRTYGSVGEALGNRRFYPENFALMNTSAESGNKTDDL